uniref:Uncharacterized protein n=1 Tax=uncultured bacterium contig00087 TaxID=1181560 RepID=A0A806K1V7_9BACT|nr:hypothetical protein [uncultured bacterium contig00087]
MLRKNGERRRSKDKIADNFTLMYCYKNTIIKVWKYNLRQ